MGIPHQTNLGMNVELRYANPATIPAHVENILVKVKAMFTTLYTEDVVVLQKIEIWYFYVKNVMRLNTHT